MSPPADAWTAYHTHRHQLERQLAVLHLPAVHIHGDVDLSMTTSAEEVWEALTLYPLYSL